MIVGSVLLVIAAGLLLGLGLIRLDEPLLYSSIGVSALAALTLVVGVRRLAATRAGRGAITVRPVLVPPGASQRPVGRATPRPVGRAKVARPEGVDPGDLASHSPGSLDDDPTVPADEPAPESVTAPDLARIGRLTAPVVVVDGRPRFHLSDCTHLLGLEAESLPVAEAIELGFTPCGQCRPATALLLTDLDDDTV